MSMDLEAKVNRLSHLGYWPTLSLGSRGWTCTLYNGVMPHRSPPTGDGRTALEALDNADSERIRLEAKR